MSYEQQLALELRQKINKEDLYLAKSVFSKDTGYCYGTACEVCSKNIEWLITQGVEFIEQPMPSTMLEETAWLRERVEIPIIADEAVKSSADIPVLAEAYDGINIKLMKSGGLLEAFRMIQMAKALNLKIMLGCMIESSVAVSAAAHIAPFVDWADLDGNLLISNDPFSGVKVKEGKLIFNSDPGLGVKGEF